MKKLLFFIPLLLSFLSGLAQPEIPRQTGNSNTLIDRHVFVAVNFRPPVYPDTLSANTTLGSKLDSAARLIYTYDVGGYWLRHHDPKRWIRVGSVTSLLSSNTILVSGDGSSGSPYIPTLIRSPQSGNAVQIFPDGVYVPSQIQNGLIEGGRVIHRSGLTYTIQAARYAINGVIYTSPEMDVTLDNAHASLSRFDAFIVNTSSTADNITGTPSDDPQNPSYDPLTQLPLTFVEVTPNMTAPTFCRDSIYYPNNGNTYTAFPSNATRINVTSTTDPYSVTQAIAFTAAQNNDQLRMEKGSAISVSTYSVMVLRMKSLGVWAATSRIAIQFYNGLTPLGIPVIIGDNTPYGFNSSNTANYQTVIIPVENFGNTTGATNVLITVQTTGGNTISFRLDDWELLGCDGTPPPTTGSFWNTTGNQEGRILYGGTLDNFPIQFLVNNLNHTQLQTNGTTWMQGTTNPGISFLLGSFGSADYWFRRSGTTIQTNTAGVYELKFTGNDFYEFNKNDGHIWSDSLGTERMQLFPTGAFQLANYGDNLFTGTATRWLAVDVNGNVIEQAPPTGISSITANNGLSTSTATNVQLGGNPLLFNTNIPTSAFSLTVLSSSTSHAFAASNSNAAGIGVWGDNSSTGYGVRGTATSNYGGYFSSSSGAALLAESHANVGSIISNEFSNATFPELRTLEIQRYSTDAVANGIGVIINLAVETTVGTARTSNQIKSIFTEVADATRKSKLVFTGGANGTTEMWTMAYTGQYRYHQYGVGAFTAGTPAYGLAVDVSGNVIESPIGGGISGITADNGLTASTSTNVQLGGTLLQNTTIATTTAFSLTVSGNVPVASGNGTLIVANNSADGSAIYASANTAIAIQTLGTTYGVYSTAAGVGGVGVRGNSGSGSSAVGVFGSTTDGIPLSGLSSNSDQTSVLTGLRLTRSVSIGGSDGIGQKIVYTAAVSTGVSQTSNELVSIWSTANSATRVSEFSITGVDNAVTATLFTLSGTGALQLNNYGVNTFAGVAAYVLGVDASGNVVEVAAAGAGMANVLTTTGDIIYSSSGSTPARLGIGTAGQVLTVVSGVPAWTSISGGGSVTTVSWTGGIVSIANPTTAPAFTIAGTSGGGVYFSSSSAWASTAVLGLNQIMIGGGAGSAYSTTTTGTGVLTALGVNVGSAGAFVTFNGAGGTPSSITLTNATGLSLATGVTGTLDETNGGTGTATYTTGQILYASATNTLSKLSIGSVGQVLTVNAGGVPVWSTPSTGGTVQSVSGTSNRITITGTPTLNPVVDIASTYVGQTSITTLGTITTGTWNGTVIGATFGGTAQTSWTTGDILYASASNTLSKRAIGSNGQVLTVSGGVPTWVTPGTGGSVTAFSFVNANGFTGTVATPNTTPALTLGTNLNGMLRGTGTAMAAVTSSTVGQVLRVTGANAFAFGQIDLANSNAVVNTLPATLGGTGFGGGYTAGQIIWANSATTLTRGFLNGTANQINIASSASGVTVSHAFNPFEQTLVSAGTITWNVANGANAFLTLNNTGATLATPTNLIPGYTYTLTITQGSGGSRTITTWTNVRWENGTLPTLSTTAGQTDVISLYCRSTTYLVGTMVKNVQ